MGGVLREEGSSFLGEEAFWRGDWIFVWIFSGVGSFDMGVFGEPLQGAPACWGFWAWGLGFLSVS